MAKLIANKKIVEESVGKSEGNGGRKGKQTVGGQCSWVPPLFSGFVLHKEMEYK